MYLLSGSFGEGSVQHYRGTISISPRGLFAKQESISISDVLDIQPIGADAKKKIGETAAFGGAGLTDRAIGSRTYRCPRWPSCRLYGGW